MSNEELVIKRVMNECFDAIKAMPGMTTREAEETVESMAQQAEAEAREKTDDIFIEGYGPEYLRREKTNAKHRAAFQKRRDAGATDEDLLWWWNLSVFEQQMLLAIDEMNKVAFYLFLREGKGMDKEEAAKRVLQLHPKWGDPTEGEGPDRPLPVELKQRVVMFIEKHYSNMDELHAKMNQESSFNALVRRELLGEVI